MLFEREPQRPQILSGKTLGLACVLHVALFVGFWIFALMHGLFDRKETVIPIDLTVVVNENLDGEENEPPPLNNDRPPEPEPEPPKPKVEPPPEPKVEHVEAVEQVPEKPKPEKKVEEQKPEKPKEPEKPKKTKEELRKERMEQMRKDAKFVKKATIEVKNVPSGNGRTERKTLSDREIRDLLNKGYTPGTKTQLAANELQLCLSLIKQAFYAKWDRPAWSDTLRPMVIRVWFGAGGRIVNFRLEQGSGDARADASITQAARLVGSVPGLTPDFISQYRTSGIPVRFTVTPQ